MEHRYSLWAVPDEPWHSLFTREIGEIARKNHAETFCPHVTLISQVPPSSISELVALDVSDLTLKVGPPEYGCEDFLCVYYPIQTSMILETKYKQACSIVDLNPQNPFFHMSVGYKLENQERYEALTECRLSDVEFSVSLQVWEVGPQVVNWRPIA